MQKLLIKGKQQLSGKISISGSKNSSLPILAATILGNSIKLSNVPLVKDIFTMIELLKFIGLTIKISKDIDCSFNEGIFSVKGKLGKIDISVNSNFFSFDQFSASLG